MKSQYKQTLLIVALVAAVAAALFYGRFSSSSVCYHCGRVRHRDEWQLPIIGFTLFQTSAIENTALSLAIADAGLVAPEHTHDWWVMHGSGNGILCALGRGHGVFQAVHDPRVPDLILAAHRYGEPAFARQITNCLFDRKTSDGVRMVAAMMPDEGFGSAEDFRSWRLGNRGFIDSFLKSR